MSTATLAGPDLSGHSDKLRTNVLVALTQGAVWRRHPDTRPCFERWVLEMEDGSLHFTLFDGSDPEDPDLAYGLPDFFTDPGAWGPVMQREFCSWESDERGHRVLWWVSPVVMGGRIRGPWADTLPLAVVLGTLKKHGKEMP